MRLDAYVNYRGTCEDAFRYYEEHLGGRGIGLGCVGTEPGRVDSVAEIVARVEAALKHLDAKRITLNPDCGFAPGSAAVVSLDEVYQKLKNEAAAAQILRDKYT